MVHVPGVRSLARQKDQNQTAQPSRSRLVLLLFCVGEVTTIVMIDACLPDMASATAQRLLRGQQAALFVLFLTLDANTAKGRLLLSR